MGVLLSCGHIRGQRRDESLLGHVNAPNGLHTFLAFLLLFQQLALTRDIAAVTLSQHVFAQGFNRFSGDDASAHCGLHGDLKLLPGDEFLQALGHALSVGVSGILMDDGTESINAFTVEKNVNLHQVSGLLAGLVVIQRGVAAGARFKVVEEIKDDFCQWQRVVDFHAVFGEVVHSLEGTTTFLAQFHHGTGELGGGRLVRPRRGSQGRRIRGCGS